MGADTVFSEELVGFKLSKCVRTEESGYIRYNCQNSTVLVTRDSEKCRLIVQLGVPEAVIALSAAQMVERDVSGIDINMGCPKEFSIQAKMGAALLNDVNTACDIVKTLRRNLSVPISCKIRLLDGPIQKTIDFARALENAGCQTLTLHARYRHERPRDEAHWDLAGFVRDSLAIPMIMNGDIFTQSDVVRAHEETGISSLMIARGALRNPSIFGSAPPLPIEEVIQRYIDRSREVDNLFANSKYVILEMLKENNLIAASPGLLATASKSFDEMTGIFDRLPPERSATIVSKRSRLS